ncbi:MAG: MAPEG family protein, partial [Parasphingopyxis sp.]
LTLAMIGAGAGLNATLAWVYVGLRVLHSLVQVTINRVMFRFMLFALSSIVLIWLTINAAMTVF